MVAALRIAVVPTYVVFGSESYRDGVDLTKEQFYEKLATTQEIPKTATPPPVAYEAVYRQLADETDTIISIHLTANLSGLFSAASVAAENVRDAEIVVIDSTQISMGYGWMVDLMNNGYITKFTLLIFFFVFYIVGRERKEHRIQ